MKPKPDLSQEFLLSVFNYDSNTGVLYWRKPNPYDRHNRPGDVAGGLEFLGYLTVFINGKVYKLSRVAWVMSRGPIPHGYEVDHRNRIKTDNRLDNLRLSTRSQNMMNTDKYNHGNNLYRGVTFHKKSGKHRARITKDGKRYSLGLFITAEAAREARIKKEVEMYGEFSSNY
jgi:HNH endonuclease